jgi:hypothetical protein
MITRLPLVLLSLTLLAGTALAKDKSTEPIDQVECAGVYGAESSEAMLIETFGAENVVTGELPGPEGTTYIGTTVYGDDPDRAMVFSWYDEENHAGLSGVQLAPSQIGPGGVRVGMSVAEVEAINGEPFTISGFWWDYGGYAGFNSGNLFGVEGDCYVNLRFAVPDEISGAIDTTPISGDREVPSGEGLLEVLGVTVGQVSLGYANGDYAN